MSAYPHLFPVPLWKPYVFGRCSIFHPYAIQSDIRRVQPRCGCMMEFDMMDVFLLALGLGFFALALAYTKACDGL